MVHIVTEDQLPWHRNKLILDIHTVQNLLHSHSVYNTKYIMYPKYMVTYHLKIIGSQGLSGVLLVNLNHIIEEILSKTRNNPKNDILIRPSDNIYSV